VRAAARRSSWAVPVLLLVAACASSGGNDGAAPPPPSTPTQASTSPASSAPAVTPTGSTSATEHQNSLPEGQISGNLGVLDQTGDGTKLRLSAEIDGVDGWVVVQRDRGGKPGPVIGLVHRGEGVHDDIVVVKLRPKLTSSQLLWVTLYLDRGKAGVFQPGRADRPLQFIGKDLRRPVQLTVTG